MAPQKSVIQDNSQNQLLASLSSNDFSLLKPHLVSVDLQVPKQLESPNKPIDNIYFIESGFASVVADGGSRRLMEIGLIGREGMTGMAVLMGADRSPNDTYMQSSGKGLRMTAANLRDALGQSVTLSVSLLRYGFTFYVQTVQTAVAGGRCTVEERLARWLLMAHDRSDGDNVFLTHEFLSLMIGVRRASITDTLRALAEDDLIAIKRGSIAILDRVKLQRRSHGAYVVSKAD